jgi:acetyl-CoA carboxylase carboxyltransferase component
VERETTAAPKPSTPHETRARLIAALRTLENKRDSNPKKKRGNIPL